MKDATEMTNDEWPGGLGRALRLHTDCKKRRRTHGSCALRGITVIRLITADFYENGKCDPPSLGSHGGQAKDSTKVLADRQSAQVAFRSDLIRLDPTFFYERDV
jgi:hypothetical protein